MRNPLITTILTQYHIYKRLNVFGKPGGSAILKDLKQLHVRMVMYPKNANGMTMSEKKAVLQHLIFLKQKRRGKIKGTGFADGRKQRKYLTKDNTSATTVATEALFLTCLIDAMEHQKFATVYIPGALIQADMEGETVNMKLEGKMTELPTNIDPKLY